ncbi:DUF7556 family protein [Halorussus amylolyticus]|uniref:DUF7556 family protein n=1 Tax=Halorussus amylolyticus TaxID=1126242 RepID=UPI00104E94F7|nr:hypothetical protein [Halorussus amylolyticus]
MNWTIPPVDDIDESFEDGDVMLAVDDADDEPTTIIADVSNDEAWLAMPYDESNTLSQWR